MLSITDIEKVKNPIVAAFAGGAIGVVFTWISLSSLHEVRVKNLESIKLELERQITVQAKIITGKNYELNGLQSKLSTKSITVASVIEKPGSGLRHQIALLDNEINSKKGELARYGRLRVTSFSGTNETPKSEEYIRMEKELQALDEQRNLAGKRLIETLSK